MIKNKFIFAAASFLTALLLMSDASAIHRSAGELYCGSCHTMHNSQGNQPMEGLPDGSIRLLRGAVNGSKDIHKLCLQCHGSNGAQATAIHMPYGVVAPKVYASGTWNKAKNFSKIGAGGDFFWEIDPSWNTTTSNMLGKGHSLGITDVLPPGGDQMINRFSCTSCHDPHGADGAGNVRTNLFRNLWVRIREAGANAGVKFTELQSEFSMNSYVGGVTKLIGPAVNDVGNDPWAEYFGGLETDDAGEVIWPIYRGTMTGNTIVDTSNSNSYGSGWDNLKNNPSMSLWCAQCHDAWHEDTVEGATNQAHVSPLSLPEKDRHLQNNGKVYTVNLSSRKHASNSQMPRASARGCGANCHKSLLDRSKYDIDLITAGKGLPVTTNNAAMDGPGGTYSGGRVFYLPQSAPGNSMDDMIIEGRSHKVFCLSCHFAHGGPYNDALRWDYSVYVSPGDQEANATPANVGCQLCHNRGP